MPTSSSWIPQNTKFSRIFGLDAFRGTAAILVFLFHFYTMFLNNQKWPILNGQIELSAFLTAGHLGVTIFFVLSGFLIFLSFMNSKSLKEYFHRRFSRIIPLALIYIIIIFLWNGNYHAANFWDMGAHFLFIQSFFIKTYHGGFPIMWTLSLEMLFYLFIPVFFWLTKASKKRFWIWIILLLAINFLYRGYVSQFFSEWNTFERIFYSEQLWGRFDQFAFGIILGYMYATKDKTAKINKYINEILIGLGITGFVLLYYFFGIIGSNFREYLFLQVFLHSAIGAFFAIFLQGFMHTKNVTLKKILSPNWLQYIGKISYGIYLWHFPILYSFQQLKWSPLSAFFATLFLTLIISILTWNLVEKPFLKFHKKHCARKSQ